MFSQRRRKLLQFAFERIHLGRKLSIAGCIDYLNAYYGVVTAEKFVCYFNVEQLQAMELEAIARSKMLHMFDRAKEKCVEMEIFSMT